MVPALCTLEGDDLRSGASSRSLVGQFDALLVALGAEPAFDGIELLFLLLEVVDIGEDRTCKDDEKKKQKVYGIDGSLLRWCSCAAL